MAEGQTTALPLYKQGALQEEQQAFKTDERAEEGASTMFQRIRQQQAQSKVGDYQAGTLGFRDLQDYLSTNKESATGRLEKGSVDQMAQRAQQTEYAREEQEMAGKYDRGEITFDDYLQFLNQAKGRYVVDTPEFQRILEKTGQLTEERQRAVDSQWASNFETSKVSYDSYKSYLESRIKNTGVDTPEFMQLQEELKRAGVVHQQLLDTTMKEKYARNEVSYNDYIKYLNSRLSVTVGGTAQYAGYEEEWGRAYQQELNKLDDTMNIKFKNGDIGQAEYDAYLQWRATKEREGYTRSLYAPRFEYTAPTTATKTTTTSTSGTTSGTTTQLGTKVTNPDYLKYYTEKEIIRQDGNIYLKPGIDVRWTKTPVPNPDYLKYYQESDLIREGGKIYLKPGVPKRW